MNNGVRAISIASTKHARRVGFNEIGVEAYTHNREQIVHFYSNLQNIDTMKRDRFDCVPLIGETIALGSSWNDNTDEFQQQIEKRRERDMTQKDVIRKRFVFNFCSNTRVNFKWMLCWHTSVTFTYIYSIFLCVSPLYCVPTELILRFVLLCCALTVRLAAISQRLEWMTAMTTRSLCECVCAMNYDNCVIGRDLSLYRATSEWKRVKEEHFCSKIHV